MSVFKCDLTNFSGRFVEGGVRRVSTIDKRYPLTNFNLLQNQHLCQTQTFLKARRVWGPRKSRANNTSEGAPLDPPRTPLKTPSKAETGLMGWLKLEKEEPGKWVGRDRPVKPCVAEQDQQQETGVAELPGYQFKSPTPSAMKEVDIIWSGNSFPF